MNKRQDPLLGSVTAHMALKGANGSPPQHVYAGSRQPQRTHRLGAGTEALSNQMI